MTTPIEQLNTITSHGKTKYQKILDHLEACYISSKEYNIFRDMLTMTSKQINRLYDQDAFTDFIEHYYKDLKLNELTTDELRKLFDVNSEIGLTIYSFDSMSWSSKSIDESKYLFEKLPKDLQIRALKQVCQTYGYHQSMFFHMMKLDLIDEMYEIIKDGHSNGCGDWHMWDQYNINDRDQALITHTKMFKAFEGKEIDSVMNFFLVRLLIELYDFNYDVVDYFKYFEKFNKEICYKSGFDNLNKYFKKEMPYLSEEGLSQCDKYITY